MFKRTIAAFLCALLFVFALPITAAGDGAQESSIVVIVENTSGENISSENLFFSLLGGVEGAELLYGYVNVMDGFSATIPLSALAYLTSSDGIETCISRRRTPVAIDITVDNNTTGGGMLLKSALGLEEGLSGFDGSDCSTLTNGIDISENTSVSPLMLSAADIATDSNTRDIYSIKGEGMVAAVIDMSFDVKHEVFTLSDPSRAALSREDINDMVSSGLRVSSRLKVRGETPYVSAKIPFAYDYAQMDKNVYSNNSHGTHVAGIIAGNKSSGSERAFDGIAPEAQLLLMKAGGDSGGYLDDYAVMAALDDAISLGADVINVSFGITAGFSGFSVSEVDYLRVFERAYREGIDIFCAAGNEKRLGEGSGYHRTYNNTFLPTALPDYGLISEPASFGSAIAVASYENDYITVSEYIKAAAGDIIYSNSSRNNLHELGGDVYEYAAVPGIGEETDFEGLDISGKIVLIERGVITFEEKITNAKNAGAVAAIIYNNKPGNRELVTMDVGKSLLPAAFITTDDGKLLLSAADKTLAVVSGSLVSLPSPTAGEMSEFSSWGATPSLALKPDLCAPGGNIRSAIPGDNYGVSSGTSMSAPFAAGVALLLRQSLGNNAKSLGISYIRRTLMASATPAISAFDVEYSPRKQGAGIINLDGALLAEATIYSEDNGEAKIEAGDMLGSEFSLVFTVKNQTDRQLTYTVSATSASDGYKYDAETGQYFINGESHAFTRAAITVDGGSGNNLNRHVADLRYDDLDIISVEPGDSVMITLNVALASDEFAEYSRVFGNGFYIEGYIFLTPAESGSQLSIPYLGFSDDWGALPIFDDQFSEQHAISYVSMDDNYYTVLLGVNAFGENEELNPSLVAISPNGDGYGDMIGMMLTPSRNAVYYYYEITGDEGDVITTGVLDSLKKGYYLPEKDALASQIDDFIWDGSDADNSRYTLPDGFYRLSIYAMSDYRDTDFQSYSLYFYVDTIKPVITSKKLYYSGGRAYLELAVADNYYIQSVWLYEAAALYPSDNEDSRSEILDEMKVFDKTPISEDTITFDVTEHISQLDYFYVDIIDYAYNWVTYKIYQKDLS